MHNAKLPFSLSCLVIFAVVMAWFSPWWAGGKFLAPLDLQNRMMSPWNSTNNSGYSKNHFVSDAVDQYLVYRLIAERDLRAEGRVGWSDLTYGGTAQYANTMALYDDWTMQLHRWFDFKTAWHLGLLLQALVAAMGMFMFMRGRSINAVWCICGALLWAANSQFVTWVYHRWTLGSFCWVPWILWSIDDAKRGGLLAEIRVPFFIALAFLGGTLQHAAMVVLVVMAAWWEWEAGNHRTKSIMSPCRLTSSPSQESLNLLLRFFAWGGLATCLAAFMFVPCVLAFLESNQLGLHTGTYGRGPGIYPEGPLQPILHLVSYPLHLFPSLIGRCDSLDVLKLFKSKLFYICFFGTLPMLMAAIACLRRPTPTLARLLVFGGVILPLTPLVRVLYQRLFLLAILGGILAFAHFMTHSSHETRRTTVRWLTRISTAVFGIGLLGSLIIRAPAIDQWLRETVTPAAAGGGSFGHHQEWVSLRICRFIDGLAIWSPNHAIPLALLALGILGMWMYASTIRRRSQWGAWLIAIAAIADISIFGARWLTWSSDPLFPETAETRVLREEVGRNGRITTVIHPSAHMALTPFIPNILAAYDIATISGYDSIVPDGMILPNESPADARKLGRLAVTHLITWHGNPDIPEPWKKIWGSEAMDLYDNPLAIPRYAGYTEAERDVSVADADLFNELALDDQLGLQNRREIGIPAGVCRVRIAENAAQGWQYRLQGDSKWQPVVACSDGSMMIEFPASEKYRLLEMRYSPIARHAGWCVSALAALTVICIGLRKPRVSARNGRDHQAQ